MAASDALSARTQEAVLSRLPEQHKDNVKSAQKRGLFAAGGVALYAGAAALAPVVAGTLLAVLPAVAMFAGSAITLIAGAKLIGNAARALTLHQVKTGVAKDGFLSKLKQKAGKAWQRSATLNKVSNIAFWTVIGTAVAAGSAALAPIAAIVYPFALGGMFAAWGASEWNNGVTQGAVPTTKFVYDIQTAGGAVPPAASAENAQAAKPKKTLSSLLDVFKRKAANNNNTPKAPAAIAPANNAPKP